MGRNFQAGRTAYAKALRRSVAGAACMRGAGGEGQREEGEDCRAQHEPE